MENIVKIIVFVFSGILLNTLSLLADSTLYTIKITNQVNVPLGGVQIYGNHDFSNLGGAITGSDGKFLFDLRDLDRKSSNENLSLYFVQNDYRFEPSELEVNPINCPKRICSVKAILDKENQSALVRFTFVSVNNKPIPEVNVALSDSSNVCGRKTDGYGSAYFITRKRLSCNDIDNDLLNDTNKIMLLSPKDYQCNFTNVVSAICANKTINQLATSITCSAINLNNTSTNYTIRARTKSDIALSNVKFKIIPADPNKVAFDSTTNSSGTIVVPFSQIGSSSNPVFRAVPYGSYSFFPPELNVNPETCPGRICHFYGASSAFGQEVVSLNIKDQNNQPKSGVPVRFEEKNFCMSSIPGVSDVNGNIFMPAVRKRNCNEENITNIISKLNSCEISHVSSTPFKFCYQGNTNISLLANCSNSDSEHIVSGRVLDPYGFPLANKAITAGGQLLTKSREDGSFSFKLLDGDTKTINIASEDLIFDPQSVTINRISSDNEINFRAVTGVDGMPEERDGEFCEVADEYTVSGTVYDRSGKVLSGITILNNHEPIATTDSSGKYSFVVDAYEDVWVTAELDEELFNPAGLAYPAIACDKPQTNFQITGTPSFMQAGTIYDNSNQPILNFDLSLLVDGRHRSDLKTDSAGYYRVMLPEDTAFEITANDNRYICNPKNISGVSENDQTHLNFICVPDNCPGADKLEPGVCGCSIADVDRDEDGKFDCEDSCPDDQNKSLPGICGCGVSDIDTDNDGTPDCNEVCSTDPLKTNPGICGCGIPDIDSDNDGYFDCKEECIDDPLKREALVCGCNIKETDSDNDGYPDCVDFCKADPNKKDARQCGCGTPDVDTDNDGTADCIDQCKNDPNKILPGVCGCGVSDGDSDEDGIADCYEECPQDRFKTKPGICGCGISDIDSDLDKTPDCKEECPNDPKKTKPGICGCGVSDLDRDKDGTSDCNDLCPLDPKKIAVGACGCGIIDADSDKDGTPDCIDFCPQDSKKVSPGKCGCGKSDLDSDNDGLADCEDSCPKDKNKSEPGVCGCGVEGEVDSDADGVIDCKDKCAQDKNKIEPGVCGCGTPDLDSDKDGTADCKESCINDPLKTSPGLCGCGIPDLDSDKDGKEDCNDQCPSDPLKVIPGACGCGNSDLDSDGDGTANCIDLCPNDSSKINPGQCGCGQLDTDSDGDGVANCIDTCPTDKDKSKNSGICGCGIQDIDSDNDGVFDCKDSCPNDSNKSQSKGICGCGVADLDTDLDGVYDCNETCPQDKNKTAPGMCGCGISDINSDKDSKPDCLDECPLDPNKISKGVCGCGKTDTDSNKNGLIDCEEKKLNIIDVCRAPEDKAEEKVTLCHKESKKNQHTIIVSRSAVSAHLAHGDVLGNCEDSLTTQSLVIGSSNNSVICYKPEGSNDQAHTIEFAQVYLDMYLTNGNTLGECAHDPAVDKLRWKITNTNPAKYSGYASIVNSSPSQNIQFQIDKNTSTIITSKKILGQNTARLIVDGIEHSVATHKLQECPKDLPKANIIAQCIDTASFDNKKVKWKITNNGNIKFSGTAKILNSNPEQSQNIELSPNQEIEIVTNQIAGVNELAIIINNDEIAKLRHPLVRCPREMPTAQIETSCIDTINFEDQRLKWKIKNTSNIKLTGFARIQNSNPLQNFALNIEPNQELEIVSDQIDGDNNLVVLVDDVEIARAKHLLNECEEANLVLAGSIKGVNGRVLSPTMKKLLERFPVTLKLRNNTSRKTISILLKDPYDWSIEVPRGDNVRIWLEAGDWIVASAPRVFRENPALISSNGYNFALRRRTLNLSTLRIRGK